MIQPVPTLPPRRRGSTWLWAMLVLLALSVLIVMTAAQWVSVSAFSDAPIRVVIDGDDAFTFKLASLSPWDKAGILAAAVIAVFTMLVIVPLTIAIALAAVLVGLAVGVGVPVLALLLVCAVALSPLWLLAMFLAWLWRRSAPGVPRAGFKIAR